MNQTKIFDDGMAELLERIALEMNRCEQIVCDMAGIDSECAHACRFDAGVLCGFQGVLQTIIEGKNVTEMIADELACIAQLNLERE